MSAFFGRFHGDTKPEPGESKGVRDAYDRMLAQDPRCEHGKKPGKCIPCKPGGTR